MKKINFILLGLMALLTFSSCSKDDDQKSDPQPEDKTVTLKDAGVSITVVVDSNINYTELAAAIQKAISAQLSSDQGTASVTSTGSVLSVKVTTKESKVDDVVSGLNAATDSICKVVDTTTGLKDLEFSLYNNGSSVYTFAYKSLTYNPEGDWRMKMEDGTTCTLFVRSTKEGTGYDAALTYDGQYRLGKVVYNNKKNFVFTATDELSKTETLELDGYFDGGKKTSFLGTFIVNHKDWEDQTFNKIDITDEQTTIITYELVDPDNELSPIMGDQLDAFKAAVSASTAKFSKKDYADIPSFWEAMAKWASDIVGKISKAILEYASKYPELYKTNAYIQVTDYAEISDGIFEYHSDKIYFNPDKRK